MINDLKEYKIDYLVLLCLLGVGTVFYYIFRKDPAVSQLIAAAMGLTYVLWGIVHHHHSDRVTTKIVLEYSLIALFGFLVINSLLIWR